MKAQSKAQKRSASAEAISRGMKLYWRKRKAKEALILKTVHNGANAVRPHELALIEKELKKVEREMYSKIDKAIKDTRRRRSAPTISIRRPKDANRERTR